MAPAHASLTGPLSSASAWPLSPGTAAAGGPGSICGRDGGILTAPGSRGGGAGSPPCSQRASYSRAQAMDQLGPQAKPAHSANPASSLPPSPPPPQSPSPTACLLHSLPPLIWGCVCTWMLSPRDAAWGEVPHTLSVCLAAGSPVGRPPPSPGLLPKATLCLGESSGSTGHPRGTGQGPTWLEFLSGLPAHGIIYSHQGQMSCSADYLWRVTSLLPSCQGSWGHSAPPPRHPPTPPQWVLSVQPRCFHFPSSQYLRPPCPCGLWEPWPEARRLPPGVTGGCDHPSLSRTFVAPPLCLGCWFQKLTLDGASLSPSSGFCLCKT